MDKWTIEFVMMKNGTIAPGSFWSCTVEQDGVTAAIKTAIDKMIDTVAAEDGQYFRVFRATNDSLMARKTGTPVKS